MNKCKSESKKGRKPKGGKLVIIPVILPDIIKKKSNIILHLKCTILDLEIYESELNLSMNSISQYNPNIEPDKVYISYNDDINTYTTYEDNFNNIHKEMGINEKLHQLKVTYHNNNLVNNDKRPACFWCTYHYDGINYLIPKHIMDGEESVEQTAAITNQRNIKR